MYVCGGGGPHILKADIFLSLLLIVYSLLGPAVLLYHLVSFIHFQVPMTNILQLLEPSSNDTADSISLKDNATIRSR